MPRRDVLGSNVALHSAPAALDAEAATRLQQRLGLRAELLGLRSFAQVRGHPSRKPAAGRSAQRAAAGKGHSGMARASLRRCLRVEFLRASRACWRPSSASSSESCKAIR